MNTMSASDRRAVTLGALIIFATVVVGRGVPRWRVWEQAQTAHAMEARLRRLTAERAGSGLAAARDSADARERRINAVRAFMISAPTPEAAAASLATIVESMARDAHVDVGSIAVRPDTLVTAGSVRVGVRLSAEGDVKGLTTLLSSVESNETPMSVIELSVSQPETTAPPSRPEALRFEVHIRTLASISAPARVEATQ